MNAKIDVLLEQTKADALLITDPYNMRYISGFRGGEGILYLSRNQHVLITDSRYTEAAMNESDFTVAEENREHKRTDLLKECLERDGAQILGYEDCSMLCCEFDRFREKFPVRQWKPVGQAVNQLRQIKSPEELECLRKAESIGDAAFTAILDFLRPGISELEAAARLEYEMKLHGAHGFSFDTIMASGLHSSMPHAIPDEKKLEYGDFVTMDFGCIYRGYCSDMTRTVVLGKASEKQKEIYQTVLQAQEAALAKVRAGVRGCEVDKVARELITKAGYGSYFGHGLGHSVGLFIHEEPRLSPNDQTVLQPNMIETVEPGIYVPGFGGVRIEDMVIVTEDGCENLTHSPKHLIEL